MTTVTYTLEPIGNIQSHLMLSDGYDSSIVRSGTRFFLSADSFDLPIHGRVFDSSGAAITAPFFIGSQQDSTPRNSQSAALINGNVVTVYNSAEAQKNIVFMALSDVAGATVKPAFAVPSAPKSQEDPSVAALNNGGYVVVWTHRHSDSDLDMKAQRYGASGEPVGGVIDVSSKTVSTFGSSVAGLAGGGFAVAYTRSTPGLKQIELRQFDVDGIGSTGVDLDSTGTTAENAAILGLKDGGFALAYQCNGFAAGKSGSDIALRFFNADGSARGGQIRANATDVTGGENGGDTEGNQGNPTLTQLGNGAVVVGWDTSTGTSVSIMARAFDPQGHVLTGIATVAATSNSEAEPAFAGGDGGRFLAAWASYVDEPKPADIFGGGMQLVRKSVGTKDADKIKGDDLTDRMLGLRGKDKLKGGAADDVLKGGKGDDKLKGGSGADVLSGGKGADKLYAGKDDARDVFVFHKGDSDPGDPDRIFGFDRKNGHEKVHDVIDLSALHVTQKDIDLDFGKHGVMLLVDYRGSGKPDMAIELIKVNDLNPGDLLL